MLCVSFCCYSTAVVVVVVVLLVDVPIVTRTHVQYDWKNVLLSLVRSFFLSSFFAVRNEAASFLFGSSKCSLIIILIRFFSRDFFHPHKSCSIHRHSVYEQMKPICLADPIETTIPA